MNQHFKGVKAMLLIAVCGFSAHSLAADEGRGSSTASDDNAHPSIASLDKHAQSAVRDKDTERYKLRLTPYAIPSVGPSFERHRSVVEHPAGERLSLRINCGMLFHDPGWRYIDGHGNVWHADRSWERDAQWGAISPNKSPCRVLPKEQRLSTEQHPFSGVYAAVRSNPQAYRFAVPNGVYNVRLHVLASPVAGEDKEATPKDSTGAPHQTELPSVVSLIPLARRVRIV